MLWNCLTASFQPTLITKLMHVHTYVLFVHYFTLTSHFCITFHLRCIVVFFHASLFSIVDVVYLLSSVSYNSYNLNAFFSPSKSEIFLYISSQTDAEDEEARGTGNPNLYHVNPDRLKWPLDRWWRPIGSRRKEEWMNSNQGIWQPLI